ncbi:testis-specific protein 10-interacting protein [Microcaecilia unicolor]|uniref:Testis-specific protein 10-interacting protein n=1 Tax=Microcaecilia unicolor TaxID=1415580 RepID=A0A6P7Z9K6_9AMPH|nr:testis-specific protein 10-interacting protein [Microcaecilia unicolor]
MQDAHRWSALLNSCVAVPHYPKYRCACTLYVRKGSQMWRDWQLEEAACYQNLYESDMSEEQLDHGDGIQDCCLMKNTMALEAGIHCIRKDNGISVQVKKGPGCIPIQDCWDRREAASHTEHEKLCQQLRSLSSLSSPTEDLEPIMTEEHSDDAGGEPKGSSFPFQRMWDGSASHRDICLTSPSPSGISSVQIQTRKKSPKPTSPKPFLSAVLDSEKRTAAEATKASRKEAEKKMAQSQVPSSPSSQWAGYLIKTKTSDDEKKQLLDKGKTSPEVLHFMKTRKAWQASSSEEDGTPKPRERTMSARTAGPGGNSSGMKGRGKKVQARQRDTEILRPASAPKSLRKAEKPSDDDLTFRPTINKGVPNFERLQRKFQEQMERNKHKGKVTVCQPFHLRTSPLERHRAWEEPREKKELLEEERAWKREGGKCGSCRDCMPEEQPAPPPPLNRTFQKRQEAVRKWLLEVDRRKQEERDSALERRARARQLQKRVLECLDAYRTGISFEDVLRKKLKEFRKQDRERMAEYRAELQEMEERIKHRPFLFEQSKKPALKRHICRLLADLGFDEESIWQQESGELQDHKLTDQLNKKGMRPQTVRLEQEGDCRCWHEMEAH